MHTFHPASFFLPLSLSILVQQCLCERQQTPTGIALEPALLRFLSMAMFLITFGSWKGHCILEAIDGAVFLEGIAAGRDDLMCFFEQIGGYQTHSYFAKFCSCYEYRSPPQDIINKIMGRIWTACNNIHHDLKILYQVGQLLTSLRKTEPSSRITKYLILDMCITASAGD